MQPPPSETKFPGAGSAGYAAGRDPQDLTQITSLLGEVSVPSAKSSLFAEAHQAAEQREQQRTWLIFAFGVALTALTAGLFDI